MSSTPVVRNLPPPHIAWVDEGKLQVTRPYREWLESLDKFVKYTPPAGAYSIVFDIDGGGAEPDTGLRAWIRAPFSGTITAATALADQTGSISCSILKGTYSSFPPSSSIVGSDPVVISSGIKSESSLTGWTVDVAAGDIFGINVSSVTNITHVTVELVITRT